jgi:hypothetical protein
MTQETATFATLGASDVDDRNCFDSWRRIRDLVQLGRTRRITRMSFGFEGQGSPTWRANGHIARLASQRVDVALLSYFADGSPPLCPDLATNLAGIYADIDTIRAARSDTTIILLKMWRMSSTQETITFPNLGGVYNTNYPQIVANRTNVSILDLYGPSGLPSEHPDEWGVDTIHPLIGWWNRVALPLATAKLQPLFT